jgi:regulatory protein
MAFARKPAKRKEPLGETALYDYAVKALGRHMRSEAELRRLMRKRAGPGPRGEAAVGTAVERLKEHGYLNDASYAETYARLRQENDKLGARRVRNDLRQKGIRADVIEEAVEARYGARYGAANEETLARQHLERKRIRKPANEKETARVVRRLVAAGFSTGVITKILRQWEVPEESLAALAQLEEGEAEEGGSTE